MWKINGARTFAFSYLGCNVFVLLIFVLELAFGSDGPFIFYAMPANQSAVYGFMTYFALAEGSFSWVCVPIIIFVISLPVLIIFACFLLAKKNITWLMNILLLTDAVFPTVMFVYAFADFGKYIQTPQVVAMWIGGFLDLCCFAMLYMVKRRN